MKTLKILDLLAGLNKQELIPPGMGFEHMPGSEDKGLLPKPLQQLHSLVTATDRAAEEKRLEALGCTNGRKKRRLEDQFIELAEKTRLLSTLFWYEVRVHFNSFRYTVGSIDKNWHLWVSPLENFEWNEADALRESSSMRPTYVN